MKLPLQLHWKNIIHTKNCTSLSGMVFNRLISVERHNTCLTTKRLSSFDKGGMISINYKLYSNTTVPDSMLENSFKRDDEYDLKLDSPEFESFWVECSKQDQLLSKELQIESKRADQITNSEWDSIKNVILNMPGTINEKNIDAIIMNKCSTYMFLSLGKSYFKYLKDSNKLINRATYGNYLRLFHSCKSDCTNSDFDEILLVYKELLEVYPTIDGNTAEKAIYALSLTTHWREYENLFAMINRLNQPSVGVYKIVILTAFDHKEFELAWSLMEEMQLKGLNVPEEVFIYWIQKVKCRMLEEDLNRVLNFFKTFNIKPSDEVCEHIKLAFEEYNGNGRVTFTKVARNGKCRSCQCSLDSCYVSEEEFNELKKAFLDPVIIGKDIFQKTKPEEFQEFLDLLKKSAPFGVVLDGLNISLHGSNRTVQANTYRLKSVVKHFLSLNKNILVLGRKHMASWHSENMDYVYKNAHMFLTDNLSQDDPFMLYATLYSGLGSCFVSRDMMRSHKFLLAKPNLQNTFQKWQATHQYFIEKIGSSERVYFQEPVSFLQTLQQNTNGDWHVPYVVKGEELTINMKVDHLHRHWLCMLKNSPFVKARPEFFKEESRNIKKAYGNTKPTKKTEQKLKIKNIFKDDDSRCR